ncbi:hypothetical protein MA16_Dca027122 [Dendrobium catenatum]|uniref:Uncharacterized protein n=1 Tax=Dendrobium catenatum TaxID=906689 RepID=A0A2I0WH91_9ASPA|nr:hypothetical protein MA16_Dca027122 [Dendrobium catenatum]
MTRWEGVDKSLEKMFKTANLDCVADRRMIREAFKETQLGIDHCLFKVTLSHSLSFLPVYAITLFLAVDGSGCCSRAILIM